MGHSHFRKPQRRFRTRLSGADHTRRAGERFERALVEFPLNVVRARLSPGTSSGKAGLIGAGCAFRRLA